ncbi:MAG: hypothetical protein Q7S98_00670 [Deltaproteobacteria bacterium]|nr:hypothetical protein [Deltaproteobacteria bacterium]
MAPPCDKTAQSPLLSQVFYDTEQSFFDPSEAVCSEETAFVTAGDSFTRIPLSTILHKNESNQGIRYDLYVSTMDPKEQLTAIRDGLIEKDAAEIMVRQGHEVVDYLEKTTPPDQTAQRNEIAALRVQLDAIESEHPEFKEPVTGQSENLSLVQNGMTETQVASADAPLTLSSNPTIPAINEISPDNRAVPSAFSTEVAQATQQPEGLTSLEVGASPLETLQLPIAATATPTLATEPAGAAPFVLVDSGFKFKKYWYQAPGVDEKFMRDCPEDPGCRKFLEEIRRLLEDFQKTRKGKTKEPPLLVSQVVSSPGYRNAESPVVDLASTTVSAGAILQGSIAHSRVALAQATPLPITPEDRNHRVERPRSSSQGSSDRGRDNSKNGDGRERQKRDDEPSGSDLPS